MRACFSLFHSILPDCAPARRRCSVKRRKCFEFIFSFMLGICVFQFFNS
jgi:hypothetical protein